MKYYFEFCFNSEHSNPSSPCVSIYVVKLFFERWNRYDNVR